MSDLTGQQLGDFRVLRRLGRGAMADVYLAQQMSLLRSVALKVLSPDLARDATYVSRFQHEARAAAALVHANIVQIYDVGCADGLHFIAQEYVRGRNLGEVLQRGGRLDPGLVLDVLRQVTLALGRAHEAGIVHRDIKPENLMLAQSGEVKVADFGLARIQQPTAAANLTQVGVTMGTPLYMSPEQVEGRPLDVRSDLYSLGVTAYHLLTGEPPYRGDTPLAVAVRHLQGGCPPVAEVRPDVPLRLSRVVERLMSKEPSGRHATPGELLADLRDMARDAAAQGWAEGPENWSVLEMLAVDSQADPATRRLGRLMKESQSVGPPKRRARRAAGVVALALAGVAAGWLLAPQRLLADARRGTPHKENVRSQLYYAKVVDSPDAWQAVERYYFAPGTEEDPYYLHLAVQGLARNHLRHERYAEAEQACYRLLSLIGESDDDFRRFATAGLIIALSQQGDQAAAAEWFTQFPWDELAEFEQADPFTARALDEARREGFRSPEKRA